MNVWEALKAGGINKDDRETLVWITNEEALAVIRERIRYHEAERERKGIRDKRKQARKARVAATTELARRDVESAMARYRGSEPTYGYTNIYGQRVTPWFYQ